MDSPPPNAPVSLQRQISATVGKSVFWLQLLEGKDIRSRKQNPEAKAAESGIVTSDLHCVIQVDEQQAASKSVRRALRYVSLSLIF